MTARAAPSWRKSRVRDLLKLHAAPWSRDRRAQPRPARLPSATRMKSRSSMLMLVGLSALYLYYRYTTRTHPPAGGGQTSQLEIPALAGDEGALALDAETVRTGKQLRVRLRVKGAPGEVV